MIDDRCTIENAILTGTHHTMLVETIDMYGDEHEISFGQGRRLLIEDIRVGEMDRSISGGGVSSNDEKKNQ